MKWLLPVLLVCCACSRGGQSSDDGAPVAHADGAVPDAGPPPAQDSGPPPDAGGPRFTIVVHVVLDGDVIHGCGAGFDADALESETPPGAIELLAAAPYYCTGTQGRWECSCEGESTVSYAAGCVGAVLESCGVAAEPIGGSAPPPTDCESTLPGRDGSCEQTASGAYECRCAAAPDVAVEQADDLSCEQALFAACAEDCADQYGTCEATPATLIGSYRCDSLANGLVHEVQVTVCDDALREGLSLVEETYDHCNGYGGYCDRVSESGLRCTCTNGSTHAGEYSVDNRYAPCRRALEAACGLGDPPAGALCMLEQNDYAARCTRAPAEASPYLCECMLHGPVGDDVVAYANDEISGAECEEALARTCPQTAALTEADLAATCTYYAECDTRYVGYSEAECLTGAPDPCVACTADHVEHAEPGVDGCPQQRAACREACTELVPKATAVAMCEDQLAARDALDDGGRCLCDRCYPAFGECMTDDDCFEIFACAVAQGCENSSCETDPVCGPIIRRYYSTDSLALILQVSACTARDGCAAATAP